MSVPLWVSELAAEFWAAAGAEEPFPRQLLRPALRALQLDVVQLPALSVAGVLDWLRRRRVALPLVGPDRALRGCLVAGRGHGVIFIDGDDRSEEQRFSLAHEVAHFLRDYLQPRRRAEARIGPQVRAVFDGERPPTPEERLHGLLGAVKVGFHTHLMARDPAGRPDEATTASERDADRLACELLAPAAAVLARLASSPKGDPYRFLVRVLGEEFGLPEAPARRYAAWLVPSPAAGNPLLRRLREAPRNLSNFGGSGGN